MRPARFFSVICLLLIASTLVFAGGGREDAPTAAPAATGEFDWQRYAGTTVVLNFPNDVHYDAMMEAGVIEEFEELTGITAMKG